MFHERLYGYKVSIHFASSTNESFTYIAQLVQYIYSNKKLVPVLEVIVKQ